MKDYLRGWLAHARGRVRARTYQGYEGLIRLYALPAFGDLRLEDVSPLHLQSLYSALMNERRPPVSAGTVLNLHLVLTQAFGQAVRWGLMDRSPATGAQPPRPRRPEPTVVDADLAQRILSAVRGHQLELPVAIAIATGMRRGEILGLRWHDVDEDAGVIHVRRSLQSTKPEPVFEEPKTRRSRRAVAAPTFLRPYLAAQVEDQARRRADMGDGWVDLSLVVDRGDGGAVSPVSLSAAWPRFLRRAGLPHVRFHDLRHGHATLMLMQGVLPRSSRNGSGTLQWGSRWIRTLTFSLGCRLKPWRRSSTGAWSRTRPGATNRPATSTKTCNGTWPTCRSSTRGNRRCASAVTNGCVATRA